MFLQLPQSLASQRRFAPPACLIRRRRQDLKLRDVVVPFDQRRNPAEAPHRVLVQGPDLGANRMIVGVEQVSAMIAMAGEVELDHAFGGHRIDIADGVEAMVKRANKDVVNVQQDRAVGLLGNGRSEIPTPVTATR